MVKFVIAGCGLAGLETALRLKKKVKDDAEIIVVERNQFFSHPNTLKDVFTKNPKALSTNLKFLFSEKGITFIQEEIEDVDFENGKIELKNGKIDYGYLVFALGSEPVRPKGSGYFMSHGLEDMDEIKKHVTDTLSSAPNLKRDARDRALTIAIVGGGPNGVEMAAELNDFLDRRCSDFGIRRIDVKLILLEKKGTLLPGMHTKAGIYASNQLSRKGVDVRTNTEVEKVAKDSFKVKDGKTVPCDTVIWCGGTKPSGLIEDGKVHTGPDGRIILNDQMQSVTDATIYAVGDVATFRNAEYKGPRITSTSNVVEHSKVAASNLAASISGKEKKEFSYGKPSMWISLGSGNTLLMWRNFMLKGRVANILNRIRKWWSTRRLNP